LVRSVSGRGVGNLVVLIIGLVMIYGLFRSVGQTDTANTVLWLIAISLGILYVLLERGGKGSSRVRF